MRTPTLVLTFFLGACAGTAATTVATQMTPAASVVPLEKAEHRVAGSGKASIDLLAQGSNAFVGILSLDGGAKVPEHQDATEEYIYLLQGSGTITIDGERHDVSPETAIFMPANATVSYENGKDKMVAVQVFAGPGPAAKYDGWEAKAVKR